MLIAKQETQQNYFCIEVIGDLSAELIGFGDIETGPLSEIRLS